MGVGGMPPHLVVGGLDHQARCAGGHQDGADLLRAGAGGDGDHRGERRPGVGDERLRTVDHPLVSVEHRPGPGGAGVGSGIGLGEAEGGQRPSGEQVGQPAIVLGLGPVGDDRVDTQADRRLQRDAHRLVDAPDLLDGDAQAGEVPTAAADALGEGKAEQPEVPHLPDHVLGEVVVPVPRGGMRGDLGLGELADHLTERLVLRRELERGHSGPSSVSGGTATRIRPVRPVPGGRRAWFDGAPLGYSHGRPMSGSLVRWRKLETSDNVQDRRGMGGRTAAGLGGAGLIGVILAVVFSLLGGGGAGGHGRRPAQPGGGAAESPSATQPPEFEGVDQSEDFVRRVLGQHRDHMGRDLQPARAASTSPPRWCCSRVAPSRRAAAPSRRSAPTTARSTRPCTSTSTSSASCSSGSVPARPSSPRPTSSPMRSATTSRTSSGSCRR